MHELLVVDLHPSVAVRVELLERLRDLLDDDTRAHEAVERDPLRGRAVACTWARTCGEVYPARGDWSVACSFSQY